MVVLVIVGGNLYFSEYVRVRYLAPSYSGMAYVCVVDMCIAHRKLNRGVRQGL